MSDRRTLLAGIVLLAIAVRLAGIGDRLSEDEGFSWLVAAAPDLDTFLDRLAAFENTPPLFYALLAPLPLDDEFWVRLPSLVAGVACVPVLYLIVKPLLGTSAALVAALGLAVEPYAVSWSNFSRGFMLANLGLLLALWAVVKLAGGGSRRWWWLYAAGAVVAIYSEYNSPLFLAAVIATFAWMTPGRRLEIVALGTLPLLTLLPWLGEFLRSLDAIDESKASPHYPLSLGSLRDSTVPLFLGEHGEADSAVVRSAQFALIVAGLTAAVMVLRARGKQQALRLLGVTALGTLALHTLTNLVGPDVVQQRYLTALIPLAIALLAGGVVLLPWRWTTPAATALLLALSVGVIVQRHDRELEPDVTSAKALIEQSGDRFVLTNTARAAFYLRDLQPRLDRPLGFGVDLEEACEPDCPPLAIVDDARAPAAVRTGPGQTCVFGPIHVRLRPGGTAPCPGGVQLERGSADLQPRDARVGGTRG